MSMVWFACFVVVSIVAFFQSQRLKKLSELESAANKRLLDADRIKNDSKLIEQDINKKMASANSQVNNANKQVEKVLNENKVFHSAIEEIVNLWINDSWKAIIDKLTVSNYATQKNRMEKVFETCRKYGIEFDGRQERAFFVRLETEWKKEIEAEKAKAEQARIREIMREEQLAQKELAAELKKIAEARRQLDKQHAEHLERIKLLKEMETLKKISDEQKKELELALAENADLEKQIQENERTKSMAEMTKAGNVYVISNIGSFGEKVFKVGMTRRLIPEDRVKELGDASVPFPFDIHMMIPTSDAPALEGKLHEVLWDHRINLVNDGREFFKVDLSEIKAAVEKHACDAIYEFKPIPEASQWRESEARRQQHEIGKYSKSIETDDESGKDAA